MTDKSKIEYAIALVANLPEGRYDTRRRTVDARVHPYTTLLEAGVDLRCDEAYLTIDSDYEEFMQRGVETIRDLLGLLAKCRKFLSRSELYAIIDRPDDLLSELAALDEWEANNAHR
jgi:hypothetical protein